MVPQIRGTKFEQRQGFMLHGDFWVGFLKILKMIKILCWVYFSVSGVFVVEFSITNSSRTSMLNLNFINFCWCLVVVSTSRPHGNHGWRFTVRRHVWISLIFVGVLSLSLQAIRAETMVDGLQRASTFYPARNLAQKTWCEALFFREGGGGLVHPGKPNKK